MVYINPQLNWLNMLKTITTVLNEAIRKIARKKQSQPQPKPKPKIKLTEQQITQLGQYRQNKRNAKTMFQQKHDRINIMGSDQFTKFNQEAYDKKFENMPEEQKLHNLQLKAAKNLKEKFKQIKIPQVQRRVDVEEGLDEEGELFKKSRVRMTTIYLPQHYMKQVQKVFHKYDQKQLRDIALHFSNLMRMRYTEKKIDYEAYPQLGFKKLEESLLPSKQVEQIYLTTPQKFLSLPEQHQQKQKVDIDPLDPQINYTQNIIVSYLLNRVPRTYAVARRVLNQIKSKYETFSPSSFVDFGAGLSSGSIAFEQTFGTSEEIYSVEPASKVRKLSKYLTQSSKVKHYSTLGQLSIQVKQVDIVYCGYVINQIRPQLIEIYLQSLLSKVKVEGFLAIVEYGNAFGVRLLHQTRKWALKKKVRIVAPCPHHMKCPLASSKEWCHFDQPSGMYPRAVFGKLPTSNDVKFQKYAYIIIQKLQQQAPSTQPSQEPFQSQPSQQTSQTKPQPSIKPNESQQWDRIIYPLMKKGKHFIYNICTKQGKFEKRISAKSHGIEYKQGRKLRWGDFWRYGERIPHRYRKQRRSGKRLW